MNFFRVSLLENWNLKAIWVLIEGPCSRVFFREGNWGFQAVFKGSFCGLSRPLLNVQRFGR